MGEDPKSNPEGGSVSAAAHLKPRLRRGRVRRRAVPGSPGPKGHHTIAQGNALGSIPSQRALKGETRFACIASFREADDRSLRPAISSSSQTGRFALVTGGLAAQRL